MNRLIATQDMLRVLAPDLASIELVVVQHIRTDTASFVELLCEHRANVRSVIGIGYSAQPDAVERIAALGVPVTIVAFHQIEWELQRALTAMPPAQRVVVIDVGGYAARLVSHGHYPILGVVEETNQGLWIYRKVFPRVPVVQIADCRNKGIENVHVGQAIRDAVLQVTSDTDYDARSAPLGIVGFGGIGGIGENVCRWLSLVNDRCAVFDCDSFKMMKASAMGFAICSLRELVDRSKVVIGCTGHTCIPDGIAGSVRRPMMFISASSKDVEFRNLLQRYRWEPAVKLPHCEVARDAPLIMAYRGRPINFLFRSLPLEIGDFLFCNVVGALCQLLEFTAAPGVVTIADDMQEMAARIWAKWHLHDSPATGCPGADAARRQL